MSRHAVFSMKFDEWIERSGMRAAAVARLLGISPGHLHDLTSGRAWPGRNMALRIRRFTRGQVLPNDFLPDEDLSEPKTRAPRRRK